MYSVKFAFLFLSLTVFAQAQADAIYAPERIPSQDRRRNSPEQYIALSTWSNHEIVQDGTINLDLAQKIDFAPLGPGLQPTNFKWLQVRDLQFDALNRKIDYDATLGVNYADLPFFVSVRYDGHHGQGTLNIAGRATYVFDKERITLVEIQIFDDSSALERIGRKFGLTTAFNGYFASTIVEPILMSFFERPDAIAELNEKVLVTISARP